MNCLTRFSGVFRFTCGHYVSIVLYLYNGELGSVSGKCAVQEVICIYSKVSKNHKLGSHQ